MKKKKGKPWSHRKVRRPGTQSQTLAGNACGFPGPQFPLHPQGSSEVPALRIDVFPPNVHSTHIPLLGVAQAPAAGPAYFLGLRFSLPSICRELSIRDVASGHVGDMSWKVRAGLYQLLLLLANPGLAPLTNSVTWDKFTYLLRAFVYLPITRSSCSQTMWGPQMEQSKAPSVVGITVFTTALLFYSHQKSSIQLN